MSLEKTAQTRAPSRRPVILVVEDEAPIADLFRLTLEAKGYEALIAVDGDQAFRLLRERGNTIDVMVTDVMLPHINGLDLITVAQGQWPGIKIIVCSGQLSLAELSHTGVTVLPKPFTASDLYAALDQIIHSPPPSPKEDGLDGLQSDS